MATRTQKAAARKKAEGPEAATPPKAAKPATPKERPAAKTRPAKPAKPATKKGKGAKGKKGSKSPLVFDEVQPGWPEALDTVRAKQPGFFERLRQRRAERAKEREAGRKLRDAERRKAEEEQRAIREAQEAAEKARREEQEKEAQERQAAEDRRMKAALKRAEARAAKEEAARAAAEAAAAKAAEEARQDAEKSAAQEEAKLRRAAERQRKREELEAEERRKAEEQAARDAEAEVEARRLAANKRFQEQEKVRLAERKELEPDLEFEEASKPVQDANAMVPAKGGATAADAQADLVAAELAKRRSKPIVVVGDIPEPPRIPKAPLRPGEQEVVLQAPSTATEESRPEPAQPTESFGFSIPEAFLLLANGGGWDERAERNREGFFGGALAGAMVLELLMRGQAIVQRDRLVLTGEPTDDGALAPIVARLRRVRERKGDLTSLQQMGQLAKANRDLLVPFKQRLADRGLVAYGSRKHLGLFHRSWVEVTDEGAQERLQNRLRRAIAGGGTPEAASILLLGLLDASGLFDTVVPDEAADYNRKRLNGLLGGRDIMGYKVDPQLKALQEIATRAILGNVRVMTVRG